MQSIIKNSVYENNDDSIPLEFILEAGKVALMSGKEKEAVHWFSLGLQEAKNRNDPPWLSLFSAYILTCL